MKQELAPDQISKTVSDIEALSRQSAKQLRKIWLSLFDKAAPPYSKEYLIRRIADHWQKETYGGLSKNAMSRLERAMNLMDKGQPILEQQTVPNKMVGTKLTREYNDATYEVTITEEGFEYQGFPYGSLSAIGTRITGHKCNGHKFFGINDNHPLKAFLTKNKKMGRC